MSLIIKNYESEKESLMEEGIEWWSTRTFPTIPNMDGHCDRPNQKKFQRNLEFPIDDDDDESDDDWPTSDTNKEL